MKRLLRGLNERGSERLGRRPVRGAGLGPIFARFGYRRAASEPRYCDPTVRKYGIDPVWLHLFELG